MSYWQVTPAMDNGYAPPYEQIQQQYGTLTESEWRRYREMFKGAKIESWRGWVSRIIEHEDESYLFVFLGMDGPGKVDGFAKEDVIMFFSNKHAVNRQLLTEDQEVIFTGTVGLLDLGGGVH